MAIKYDEAVMTTMSGFTVPEGPFTAVITYIIADGQHNVSGAIFDLMIAFTSLVPGNILWDWEISDPRP